MHILIIIITIIIEYSLLLITAGESGKPLTIRFTISVDSPSAVTVSVDGQAGVSAVYSVIDQLYKAVLPSQTEGNYSITVSITKNGNTHSYEDYVFYYEPMVSITVNTPYGVLTSDQNRITVGPMAFEDFPSSPFSITISASGGSNHILVVSWGDGVRNVVTDSLPVQLNHTYTSGGKFKFKVTASAPAGYIVFPK